jgi:hypothetical protein
MIAQVFICIEYQFEGNTQDVVVNREAVSAVIYCEYVRNAQGAYMSDIPSPANLATANRNQRNFMEVQVGVYVPGSNLQRGAGNVEFT